MRRLALPRDPLLWQTLVVLIFAGLVALRLTVPHRMYFDEIHYVPAARHMIALDRRFNAEHPLLAKEILALGIRLLGDNPLGWRIMPALFSLLALFGFSRALWFATQRRFAAIAGAVLLATNFFFYVHARIAMLDPIMVGFCGLAYWQLAFAVRCPERGRGALAIAGSALGAAIACKWNAIPLAVLPGLAFLGWRTAAAGPRLLTARRGAPVPGMPLWEAGVWLGAVPLGVYALSFIPALFFAQGGMAPLGLLEWHHLMIRLQESVVKPHPYMSHWWQWVIDGRAIWYLYEQVDGVQRGVMLIGNPLTMLAGLPAVLWCAWAGIARRRWDALALAALYAASLLLWIVAVKPIQFYYHYFLPATFLTGALAVALDAAWRRGWHYLAVIPVALAVGLFVYYFPILSAAPLHGNKPFLAYAWIKQWR